MPSICIHHIVTEEKKITKLEQALKKIKMKGRICMVAHAMMRNEDDKRSLTFIIRIQQSFLC